MDEAKFHVVVDREQIPLRAESVSWKKVKGEGGGHVAEQFKSWGVKTVETVESAVAVE